MVGKKISQLKKLGTLDIFNRFTSKVIAGKIHS